MGLPETTPLPSLAVFQGKSLPALEMEDVPYMQQIEARASELAELWSIDQSPLILKECFESLPLGILTYVSISHRDGIDAADSFLSDLVAFGELLLQPVLMVVVCEDKGGA